MDSQNKAGSNKAMNTINYEQFYNKAGKANGWNFSNVKCKVEGEPLDFYSEVAKLCKPSDLLLDIGTGGREAVLTIASSVLLLIGIDQSSSMIAAAQRNAAEAKAGNTRFLHMDSESLQFPRKFFNVVSCKHAPFNAREIANVLAEDGIFLTQQVAEDDKLNLKQAFGRGQSWGEQTGALLQAYNDELKQAGFHNIQSFQYNVTEYYETAEDLIFLLKHTPIIPNFGCHRHDFDMLNDFIAAHATEQGIKTNSARFIIKASLR